jgi:hypothetical protein
MLHKLELPDQAGNQADEMQARPALFLPPPRFAPAPGRWRPVGTRLSY